MATEPRTYPAIAELVPHGPPIRALDRIVHWEPGRAVCAMTLRAGMPFERDGRVASVATLEYLAQAVAACLGYEAYVGGEGVRVGMLVGIRKMDLLEPWIQVGSELELEVERVRGSDDASTFRGTARTADGTVATAQMTLFHAEAPPSDR
jgi:predicted hotdog family 3-hydroxylacyl-ACP dehydratase